MLLLLEQARSSMGKCSRSNSCGVQRLLQLCTQGMLLPLHQAQLSLAAQLGLARQWRQLQRRVRSPTASCCLWQQRSVTMQQQLLICGRSSTGMLLKQTPAAAPVVTDRWLTCCSSWAAWNVGCCVNKVSTSQALLLAFCASWATWRRSCGSQPCRPDCQTAAWQMRWPGWRVRSSS